MADSDNSRTLSPVTRGDFHSLVAASFPTYPEVATLQNPGFSHCADDPALVAWHHWRSAWDRLSESTVHQQQLETSLFSDGLSASEQHDGSRAYNEALEAEDQAALAEELAAQALWQTSAVSIAGIIAQVDAILHRGQPSPTCMDDPWPQIRAAMANLIAIDAAVDPPGRLASCEPRATLQNS
ncbi:hypothetical protein BLJAPNOD_05303 [Ensifer sp. M14]|uniref:Uncharacterized protein n=1 Tax=Sinorhizobium sp. M14 TaxID=430451 RepID=A0A142BPU2_9HYPH|nr:MULTISPECIES: hypothetical protein [Sinorhizobium/Ensifer group]AMP35100.1 hypothetical protein pSinB_241 [Sinorhizobium sp. M14]RDL48076.1 hypothetical protein BLJAPNOD_05303 [Ensifer sp. M14]